MKKSEILVPRKRAIFLDRDGVLNAELGDYVKRPEELVVLPGVPSSVNLLVNAGWLVVVFTNQAGIGRGVMSYSDLTAIHLKLKSEIYLGGSELTDIYFCPHHPDDYCECRKPLPGMLIRAAADHQIELARSIVIGDSPRDIASGNQVGCETILLLTGKTTIYDSTLFPSPQPHHVFPKISSAANWILANR